MFIQGPGDTRFNTTVIWREITPEKAGKFDMYEASDKSVQPASNRLVATSFQISLKCKK